MIRTYPRPAFLAVALLAGGLLSITARAQTPATWVNPVDGNWTDATRWSTNPLFPNNTGPTYNAFIDQTGAPYTVTLDQGITVTDLHLTSADAILDLTTNNLVVAGDFFQASARLRGSSTGGTLTVAGTASFTGSFAAPAVVGVSTFIAQSALVFTPVTTIDICDTEVYHDGVAATWNGGDIRLDHGAHYHEGVNGTFNITSNGTLSYPALGAQSGFINAGVIRKSAGTGVTFFNGVDLDNTGTVQVEAGTFRADRPVQVSGSTLTGGPWNEAEVWLAVLWKHEASETPLATTV